MGIIRNRQFAVCLTVLCLLGLSSSATRLRAQSTLDPQTLQLSPARLAFYAKQDGSTPTPSLFSSVTIANNGTAALNWTAVPSNEWITFDRRQGSVDAGSTTTVNIGVDIAFGSVGPQQGTVAFYNTDTADSLGSVSVFFRICEHTCVSLDAGAIGHTISPGLFGSQSDWLTSGNYLWNRQPSPTCASNSQVGGAPAAGLVDLTRSLGIRLFRYPGGITGDFLNWAEAVGPVTLRKPQINPFRSWAFGVVRECPVFGPDEMTSLASELQAQVLLVANVGTGSAQGAANWLTHNLQRGLGPQWWEIGNENYLHGLPKGDPNGFPYAFAAAYQPPAQYASKFGEYARALRGVDPAVKVGAVLDPDANGWNEPMLASLAEPVDFFSTHLLFPKWSCTLFTPNDQLYRTLLAAPLLLTYQIEQLKQTIAANAVGTNKNASIAITEYGTFFWCFDYVRNHSLSSALYAAMNLHVFFREPRILIATQSNLTNPLFQSPLGITFPGTATPNALYHVFRAYSQAAGGSMTATSVLGSPTFASAALDGFPALPAVPSLDSVAVTGPEPGTLRLFVVNRSLSDNITARVAFDSFAPAIDSISMIVVNGANYTSQITPIEPNAVTTTTSPLSPAREFDVVFPAHSLVEFIVKAAQ